MKPKRWITLSLLLIFVGVTLIMVNNAVYVQKINAFYHAWETWPTDHTGTVPPSLESYSLDSTAFYVSMVLGTIGSIFVLIGASYLVIFFIAKMAKRYGYANAP